MQEKQIMQGNQNPIDILQALLSGFDFIDLAPVLQEGLPKWSTHPAFEIEQSFIHERDGFFCQSFRTSEHTGTHVDAPAHMQSDMMEDTIDRLPAEYLISPAVVYDLASLNLQAGDTASAQDLLKLESKMGTEVKQGEIALLRYGWEKYWKLGEEGNYYSLNEPGLDESAVKLLASRKIRAVGSDTVGCDMPMKEGVVVAPGYGHDKYWLRNRILIMEALMNLGKLPSRCFFLALPLRIKNGSGSPIRPVALIPR